MEEDSYALSGITVTAQKVPVEMNTGKTVYNLSATISGTQGNLVADALRQMPGVQIQSNGNILLGRTRRHQRTDEWKDNLSERRNA